MKKKLIIVGASGHGKVVADCAKKSNKWNEIFFIDDNIVTNDFLNVNIIGVFDDVEKFIRDYDIFVAIGNNEIRMKMLEKLMILKASIPVIIHPNSTIGSDVNIGFGSLIMAGAIINCCADIGIGCIVNTGAIVEHDSYIDNFVHLSPSSLVAGNVKIGCSCWIGAGAVIKNNITIEPDCIIGAGAVVTKDLTVKGTYIGVPARRIS